MADRNLEKNAYFFETSQIESYMKTKCNFVVSMTASFKNIYIFRVFKCPFPVQNLISGYN